MRSSASFSSSSDIWSIDFDLPSDVTVPPSFRMSDRILARVCDFGSVHVYVDTKLAANPSTPPNCRMIDSNIVAMWGTKSPLDVEAWTPAISCCNRPRIASSENADVSRALSRSMPVIELLMHARQTSVNPSGLVLSGSNEAASSVFRLRQH